jgi:hypothetical protein
VIPYKYSQQETDASLVGQIKTLTDANITLQKAQAEKAEKERRDRNRSKVTPPAKEESEPGTNVPSSRTVPFPGADLAL